MSEPTEYEPVEETLPFITEEELYNLRAIKLSNGNDILACILLVDPEKEYMVVKRPCAILKMVNAQDGTSTVILTKWQSFSQGEIHVINMPAIVSYCKVTPEMMSFYIQSVKNQIDDENKPKKELTGSDWPEWMNHPLERSKIN